MLSVKVLTIEEKPFVYARKIDEGGDCAPEEIPCPHYNASEDSGIGLKDRILNSSFLITKTYECVLYL